jgi:hypothetical protein
VRVDLLDLDVAVGATVTDDEVAGSLQNSQLKTTSSAVKGLPSCQVTPRLSFQVTLLPSADRPPFCAGGISAARIGTRLPSASQPASGS